MLFGTALAAASAQQGASAAAAPAQTATSTVAPTSPKPADISKEAVVADKYITRIREEADGTGSRETTARFRVLADAGVKQMAVLAFTYTAGTQQLDIAYVRVIKPDGTVIPICPRMSHAKPLCTPTSTRSTSLSKASV
jgi:hypothetical protein